MAAASPISSQRCAEALLIRPPPTARPFAPLDIAQHGNLDTAAAAVAIDRKLILVAGGGSGGSAALALAANAVLQKILHCTVV